jgi:hypothetical protein
MARELRDEFKLKDGTFKLSKKTGSLRQMAPGKSKCLRLSTVEEDHKLKVF